jgi:hypothetical protein
VASTTVHRRVANGKSTEGSESPSFVVPRPCQVHERPRYKWRIRAFKWQSRKLVARNDSIGSHSGALEPHRKPGGRSFRGPDLV